VSNAPVGVLLGLAAGLGLALTFVRLPMLRRPSLDDRLAPYLRDAVRPSRLLEGEETITPFPTLERIVRPFVARAVRLLESWLGGGRSVRSRLDRLGSTSSLEAFRVEQLLWGGLGLLGGVAVSLVLLASGRVRQPVALVVLTLLCGLAGLLLRDRRLTTAVVRREERMMAEFPTVAELLALSVGAGESAVGALERVTRVCTGELARELGRALTEARAGANLVQALDSVSRRTGLPALSRFVDGVTVAVERGTPLADVLRAQAMDVREAGRRRLLEIGGRKEIAMMVPSNTHQTHPFRNAEVRKLVAALSIRWPIPYCPAAGRRPRRRTRTQHPQMRVGVARCGTPGGRLSRCWRRLACGPSSGPTFGRSTSTPDWSCRRGDGFIYDAKPARSQDPRAVRVLPPWPAGDAAAADRAARG
jgi:tight adherence protein C